MANNLPKQPENIDKCRNFSNAVKDYLKAKGKKPSELAKLSHLSRTTISRICRNSNDKGSTYLPTDEVVMAISVGFGLTIPEAIELSFAAFPERRLWREILDKRMTIGEANEILYDNGLPLLGNSQE